MKTTCINLRDRFGHDFRVEYEESYQAERGDGARADAPWLQIVPCQNGHICPWGGRDLAACTSRAGMVAKRLRALPFVRIAQDGADGVNAVFDVDHFEVVAEIMRPRRRRRLSPERRAAAAERLREYQFQAAHGAGPDERPCVPSGAGGSGVGQRLRR